MFDKAKFEKEYGQRLAVLVKSEKSVRAELNVLSRTVLEAIHATENIGYVNRLLDALTPVNKKAAVVFFKHFAGFHYDEQTRMFTKKSKKRYDNAHALAMDFLSDPNNNLFSWAERHIEVEKKPFSPDEFTKGFKKMWDTRMQQARDNGISQRDLFRTLFKAGEGKVGIDLEVMLDVLSEMATPEEQQA